MSESTGAKILIRGRGAQKDGGSSNTGHPDDDDELHVFLEGSDDAIRKATAEIEKLFDPQYANRVKQQQLGAVGGGSSGSDGVYGPGSGDAYQIELRVPNNMVGLIIGKGGENIVRIQSQLGVHAQIAKEHEMLPGETLRSIVLKGTPSNVNEAKSRIDEIINAQIAKNSGVSSDRGGGDRGNSAGRELDHAFVVKLPVPNDKVGIIIGRGGMTIKAIQERTRAHVQIPLTPDEDNPQARTLSIGGDTKEAVDGAQMEIFMCLQTHAQQSAQNSASNALLMLVPDDKVGIIIGKGGATIKDIQNRHRVKVQIPPAPDAGSMPPMRTIRYEIAILWLLFASLTTLFIPLRSSSLQYCRTARGATHRQVRDRDDPCRHAGEWRRTAVRRRRTVRWRKPVRWWWPIRRRPARSVGSTECIRSPGLVLRRGTGEPLRSATGGLRRRLLRCRGSEPLRCRSTTLRKCSRCVEFCLSFFLQLRS